MFDWLTHLVSGSPITYPIVGATVALDAVIPIAPGEGLVLTGSILAANGRLSVVLIFVVAWAGAVLGDNVSYLLGTRLGRPAPERFLKSEKSLRRVDWARRQIRSRGQVIVVAARFLPGGRTAATFAAGTLDLAWRRFIGADLIGTGIWAAYATALGYAGGETFQHSLWKPFVIATAIGLVIALCGEGYRRLTSQPAGTERSAGSTRSP